MNENTTFGNLISEEDSENNIGFVYEIRIQLKNNEVFRYIGKKNFKSVTTRKPLKGFKRKRKIIKESNWRDYTSSNNDVNMYLNSEQLENVRYRILELCKTKLKLTYFENKYLFCSGAIEEHSIYLNSNISGKFFKGKI